ncbi:MAG: FAD-binding oxidoreductase [Candidatus Schekmanbacteria bacterium]|nr:FAD-binding oxidoreductase [Candidatus Schekmanbacteria bacterium]
MTPSHEEKLAAVQQQVRARPAGRRLTISKRHPGHSPHDLGYKSDCHPVSVEALGEILGIDTARKVAVVEGQVTLGQLCKATFAAGMLPPVVPEFETFTISGLINGLGIESSSHRYGVFPNTIEDIEVVLGSGDVVTASRDSHRDLFSTLPGSYGTLGVVTRATVRLVDALPFVRSRYRLFTELPAYCREFRTALDEHSFVEGLVLAPRCYALITSDFSDAANGLDRYEAMRHGNPWYYQHVRERAQTGGEDLVPSYQYMFRHQRSLMWLTGIIANLRGFIEKPAGRAYLDREAERKVRETGFRSSLPVELGERCMINQDMVVAVERLGEGIEYVEKNLKVYPLWNCPARIGDVDMVFAQNKRRDRRAVLAVDIGIYGEPRVKPYRNIDAMRALQTFVDLPAMWGVCYLTREELAEIYDLAAYERVKAAYHAADAFVPIERKIKFMPKTGKQGKIPAWRLVNLWYEWRANRTKAKDG